MASLFLDQVNLAVKDGNWETDGIRLANDYHDLIRKAKDQERIEQGLGENEFMYGGTKVICVPMDIWSDKVDPTPRHQPPQRCDVCNEWLDMGDWMGGGNIAPITMMNLGDPAGLKKCASCAGKAFAEAMKSYDPEPLRKLLAKMKDRKDDGKFRPLGHRNGIGTYETFFDTDQYDTWKDAVDDGEAVVVDFMNDEGVIKFVAYHVARPGTKLYHTLNYQHFPAGVDVLDDQAAVEMAEKLK